MNHKLLAPYNKIVFEQSLLKTPYTCGFAIVAFLASVLSGNPGLKNQLLQLHSQQLWIAEREWRVRASKKFAISVATYFGKSIKNGQNGKQNFLHFNNSQNI